MRIATTRFQIQFPRERITNLSEIEDFIEAYWRHISEFKLEKYTIKNIDENKTGWVEFYISGLPCHVQGDFTNLLLNKIKLEKVLSSYAKDRIKALEEGIERDKSIIRNVIRQREVSIEIMRNRIEKIKKGEEVITGYICSNCDTTVGSFIAKGNRFYCAGCAEGMED